MKNIFVCHICGKIGYCNQIHKIKSLGIRVCRKHEYQFNKYQKFLDHIPRNTKDLNEIVINKNIAEIILYYSNGSERARTIIDAEDVYKIRNIKWSITQSNPPNNYCQGLVDKKYIKLHRFLLSDKIDNNVEVDHKDKNTLNNVKSNLRICSHQENKYNNRMYDNFALCKNYQ